MVFYKMRKKIKLLMQTKVRLYFFVEQLIVFISVKANIAYILFF